MIQVEGIGKTFGNQSALSNISFQAHDHEVLGIIGLNGAGKTTLLRILATEILPSSGDITIDGYSILTSPHEIRSRIGFLPDKPPLYPEMTVRDYLTFLARLRGVPRPQLQQHVHDASKTTQLSRHLDTHLGSLSHGYQQRTSIAQAIVHKPKILILDEPTNGLDPLQIVELRDLILELKKKHTILFSSHNLSEMTKISDRLLIVQEGQVLTTGQPKELERTSTIQIKAQWEGGTNWSQVLQPIPGLNHHQLKKTDHITTGFFECQTDCRPHIAATIIQNQGQLLSLEKTHNELEKVLLRLIGGNHHD
ncbi:MAG: ABC transporter ATP-binding protein [Oligoflexales bacterium]